MTPLDKLASLPEASDVPARGHHARRPARAGHGADRRAGRRGTQRGRARAVPARAGTHRLTSPHGCAVTAGKAVDMWTMRWRAPARSVDNALRVAHRPRLRPHAHSPRPRLLNLTIKAPIHCSRLQPDRLSSRRRSQPAPGSYLNWKRLPCPWATRESRAARLRSSPIRHCERDACVQVGAVMPQFRACERNRQRSDRAARRKPRAADGARRRCASAGPGRARGSASSRSAPTPDSSARRG